MADERLIPASVNDASARAYNEMAELMGSLDSTVLLVYFIDTVPAAVLPALADQFRVTAVEWHLAQTDTDQRKLIKNAIERHRTRGTPYSIERGLEILSLAGKVTEWFEYGAAPFHFRVEIDLLTRGLDEQTQAYMEEMILAYKNRRSWLEGINIWLTNRSGVPSYALTTMGGEEITVYPWQTSDLEQNFPLYFGIGYQTVEITTLYPLPA